jgi:hypothetical protein
VCFLPLYTRHRIIEAVLYEILVLHNKPKAVVHSVCNVTGPKKKKKKKRPDLHLYFIKTDS